MPLLVGKPQEQVAGHFTVEFQVPGSAARVPNGAGKRVLIEGGSRNGVVFAQESDRPIREVGKRRGEQRDAIVEAADAALEQSLRVLGQREQKSCARSRMRRVRDLVMVKAQARAQGETRPNGPL